MQPLIDGRPGQDECWRELAEHSVEHDDLPARSPDGSATPEAAPPCRSPDVPIMAGVADG